MIQVHNLTFAYPKTIALAVQGLSFQVERGEIFGFLVPSGAGKSTTQKILIGLLKGYTGTVSVFGKDLAGRLEVGLLRANRRLLRVSQPFSQADGAGKPVLFNP